MNILFCGDKNIYDGLIISIISILKYHKEKLCIYILTAQLPNYNVIALSKKKVSKLDKMVKEVNTSSFVKRIDISSYFEKELPEKNMNTRFTPSCMLRLFSDEVSILPNKILYLDNDVIIRNSIKELYETNMDDYEIAGVLDYYGKWFFRKNIFKKDYINSGVLLMNLKNIKRSGLFKETRRMCASKNMFMPDQSALNKLCKNKLILDRKYNEQKHLKKDTVIRHFTTTFVIFPFKTRTIKPWNIEEVHGILKTHEYDDVLRGYIKIRECKHV